MGNVKNKYFDKQRAYMLGDILKCLRKKHNLSQKEIAEKIGIAFQTYSGYETGKHEPNLKILLQIANHYDISIDFLIGRYFIGFGTIEDCVNTFYGFDKENRLKIEDYEKHVDSL